MLLFNVADSITLARSREVACVWIQVQASVT